MSPPCTNEHFRSEFHYEKNKKPIKPMKKTKKQKKIRNSNLKNE